MVKENDEECPSCVANVAMGFLFKVCRESLKDKINCKELSDQFLRGEISAEQVAKKIKDAAKDDPDLMEDLEEIDRVRKTRKIDP